MSALAALGSVEGLLKFSGRYLGSANWSLTIKDNVPFYLQLSWSR